MHLYFSGQNEQIMIGNFIGDSIKGNKANDFPPLITEGIMLHRKIDDFSDKNPEVLKSKERFRSIYGKYAGVAVDIMYDHFFAANFQHYTSFNLNDFASHCYTTLLKNWKVIPWEIKLFLPFLIKHKRLQSYATIKGLSSALTLMSKKTSFPDKTREAIAILTQEYVHFENEFDCFFSDISSFVSDELKIICPVST